MNQPISHNAISAATAEYVFKDIQTRLNPGKQSIRKKRAKLAFNSAILLIVKHAGSQIVCDNEIELAQARKNTNGLYDQLKQVDPMLAALVGTTYNDWLDTFIACSSHIEEFELNPYHLTLLVSDTFNKIVSASKMAAMFDRLGVTL